MFSLVPIKRTQNYCSPRTIDRFFNDPFFRFFNELDSTHQMWNPAVEVIETESEFVFEFEVPGIEQKQLEISIEDGVLTVTGERTSQSTEDKHIRSERRHGKFARGFRLPETADPENAVANLRDGILRIAVPRKEESKPRKIEIQVA